MPNAFATIKVKIMCRSNWSPETTIDQVTRQAKADAIGQIRHALVNSDVSIIGEPVITTNHAKVDETNEPNTHKEID